LAGWLERVCRASSLKPYSPPPGGGCIRLDLNESPFPPPLPAVEEAYSYLVRGNRYPRRELMEGLLGLLSEYTGAPREWIVVGGGGDSILSALFSLLHGLRIAVPRYSFSMYARLAAVYGASVTELPVRPERDTWVVEGLVDAAAGADAVFIDRPNNPTGSLLADRGVFEEAASRGSALIVVDEAYYEFSGETLAELVEYGNVVVVRTMSKAFGMAGMRLGYAIAPPRVAEALRNILYPFPASAPSLAMASALLRSRRLVEERVARIREWRERLASALRLLGARVYRSWSNFLLVDLTDLIPGDAAAELRARGVCVKPTPLGRGVVRVSVGRWEEDEELLEAVREASRRPRA